jgi:hypothetical protein
MGAMVVASAGAARAEADLLERFRVADATAADRAVPLTQLGLTSSSLLNRFAQAGVIKPAGRDRYYLDEVAFATYRRRKGPVVVAMMVGILMMLLGMGFAIFAASAARAPH